MIRGLRSPVNGAGNVASRRDGSRTCHHSLAVLAFFSWGVVYGISPKYQHRHRCILITYTLHDCLSDQDLYQYLHCISKSVYPVYLYFQIRSLYLYRRGVVWATPLALEHKKTTAIVPGAQDAGHGGFYCLRPQFMALWNFNPFYGILGCDVSRQARGPVDSYPPHVAMDFGQYWYPLEFKHGNSK
jgi:hypothetical protein